jgi:anti-sigma regulatory factor (Ser/Thr protein kinase)
MSGGWRSANQTLMLEPSVNAPAVARALLVDLAAAAEVERSVLQSALLLTSEVVTNAVAHGTGVPLLSVEIWSTGLRVSVADSGDGVPRRIAARPGSEAGGRGLFFVETLADRWGVAKRAVGKVVWFEMDR